MPLPIRQASIRTANTDNKNNASHLRQFSQVSQIRKPKFNSNVSSANQGIPGGVDSSAATIKTSSESNQSSSRIPSPSKQPESEQVTQSHPQNNQQVPSLKGHARQRSAAIPPLTFRQKLGHTRSISAVSVNTSLKPNVDQALSTARSPFDDRTQIVPSPSKSRPVPLPRSTSGSSTTPGLRTSSTISIVEHLHNELFQLSLVLDASSETLQSYQHSLERSLAKRQARLQELQEQVWKSNQAFSASVNLAALDEWIQKLGPQRAGQTLQDLSIVLQDIATLEEILSGDDGLAASFASWQQQILLSYEYGNGVTSDGKGSMDTQYEEQLLPELQRFEHRIVVSVAAISSLPAALNDSALSMTIHNHHSLAESLMLECQAMRQIGEALVAAHRRWLRDQVAIAVDACMVVERPQRALTRPLWL